MPSLATRVAAETLRLLPRKRISRGLGMLASRPASASALRQAIDLYVRAYGVDLTEAQVPEGGFETFDDFFTRALVPGARPVEGDEDTMVSPADGRVEGVGPIERGATIRVKGTDYSVGELLGDPRDGARFEGGSFAVVYLSPRDYHRVHAPVSGPVEMVRHVGGTLLPVNAFGIANYPKLFARNERVAMFQRSAEHGEVVTVMVGAIGVGRISLSFDPTIETNVGRGPTTQRYPSDRAPHVARGEELGRFHLGSTAIVVTGPECRFQLGAGDSPLRVPDAVRMGQALGGGAAGGASGRGAAVTGR